MCEEAAGVEIQRTIEISLKEGGVSIHMDRWTDPHGRNVFLTSVFL